MKMNKTLTAYKMKKISTFLMLLTLLIGAGTTVQAQNSVTVGTQVTSEGSIVSGTPYILRHGGNGSAMPYVVDNGTNYDVPNSQNSATEACAYCLIGNGDGTWKIKSCYTNKYWAVPTGNSNLTSTSSEASAGVWSLNFSDGVTYPTAPDASSKTQGINRSSQKLYMTAGKGTGNANKVYFYEVSKSTTPLSAFSGKNISVGESASTSLQTGQWYIMKNVGRNGYAYEKTDAHALYNQSAAPSGSATDNAKFLVTLVNGTDGKYYIQNGLGNYFGTIPQNTAVPTTAVRMEQMSITQIGDNAGYYYVRGTTDNRILDCKEAGYPVVGWGTDAPSTTSSNAAWQFFPVELYDAWVPTASEVYTINNASGRGALTYDPTANGHYVWSSGKSGAAAFDSESANCQWVICPAGVSGQYYLYNVGAGKFAIPSSLASGSGNAWYFSDNAVAVLLERVSAGYKIKAATAPVSGSNDAYASVSNNFTGPIINYDDDGSVFTISQVDGQDQSTAANAAIAKLIKSQTPLATYPSTSGWYAIQIKSKTGAASYSGRYLKLSSTLYNSLYPMTFTGGIDVQPAITDPTFLTYINCTSWDVNTWQLPDGRYLVDNGNNKFPTASQTPGNVICGYDNGNYFKSSANYYADPYNSNANYFIGETTYMRTAYNVYPVDLEDAGLVTWQVIITGGSETTQVTCSRNDVSGLTSVYNNGFFFLPTGVTPLASDFSMEGSVGDPVVNTEAKTVTLVYDPAKSMFIENVSVKQGNQTTGKGNTMQALLRVKLTPFKACTLASVNVTLTGADQLDNVAAYVTTNDQLRYVSASPEKISGDVAAASEVTIPVDKALSAGATIYLWITGDVKSTATEWATIDAAITSICYSNDYTVAESLENTVLDVTSIGNPSGSMRIYKQQAELWTPSFVNTKYYRIPTIMQTADGGIVAFTDDRYSSTTDLGNHKIDVVIRKSMDNGATWSAEQTIAAGDGSSAAAYGYGDAAVVRTNSGKLICLMAAGQTGFGSGMLHMGYTESTDNGATWSTVKDIYADIDKNGAAITSAFTTAGKGVTFSNGRVAFAMNGKTSSGTNEYILYSDNEGETWSLSPSVYSGADESKLEIMNDNSLLVSVRRGSYNNKADRGWNRTTGDASGDGINLWGASGNTWTDLNANGCNGDIIYYNRETENAERPDVLFHTVIKEYVNHRYDLRLYMSFDQGVTWKEAFQLQPGWAAYSSMQKLANGDLAIIFEDGSIGNEDAHDCYAINYVVISSATVNAKIDELNDYTSDLVSNFGPYFEESATGYFALTAAAKSALSSEYTTLSSSCSYKQYAAFAAKVQNGLQLPVDGGYYRVRTSAQPNSYSRGTAGYYYYLSLDGSDLLSKVGSEKQADYSTVFKFTKVADMQYKLQSQGLYIQNYVQDNAVFQLTDADNTLNVNIVSPGVINLRAGSNAHANLHHSQNKKDNAKDAYKVVGWTWNGTASTWVIEDAEETTIPVALKVVNGVSYSTLYLPFDVQTDANTQAYYIGTTTSESAKLTAVENDGRDIPANTAVVLVNTSADTNVNFTVKSPFASVVDAGDNYLKGTLLGTSLDLSPESNYYSLGKKNGEIGFYKFDNNGTTTISLGANKAYLEVPSAGVKGFILAFDTETSITETTQKTKTAEGVFDLSGRRISVSSASSVSSVLPKGIYIVNGRKVVVK